MASIADIVKHLDGCPCQLYDLTQRQVDAAYHFEHRLLAALHRLYMQIPEHKADQMVADMLWKILDERGDRSGPAQAS